MRGKACRNCNLIVSGTAKRSCENCKSSDFSTDYQGLVIIIDPERSMIAKKLDVTRKGWYAIKVR
ncbi:MAG: transcription elongation factor subunit Spt4 [Promethearchaeati archaeon SRVP18_Atabeyarchaeia-1]